MLFWVTTRGRDRIFNNPRDSAMLIKASIRTELLTFRNENPLVGPAGARLENSGICTPVVGEGAEVPMIGYFGLTPNVEVGVMPTAGTPPTEVDALPQPNPS